MIRQDTGSWDSESDSDSVADLVFGFQFSEWGNWRLESEDLREIAAVLCGFVCKAMSASIFCIMLASDRMQIDILWWIPIPIRDPVF